MIPRTRPAEVRAAEMRFDVDPGTVDGPQPEVIDLSKAPGERASWERPTWLVFCWGLVELLFVTNPLQVSSSLRVKVLRMFGAEIGRDVLFRPRTRVRFPWKLHIGDRSWIGEGVWFHNQDHIYIGHDSVVSQETFLTTGSHRHRVDMALITRPIWIGDGVWITSRCIVLGGSRVGTNSLVRPLTVVSGAVPENTIWDTSGSQGPRFG